MSILIKKYCCIVILLLKYGVLKIRKCTQGIIYKVLSQLSRKHGGGQ